MIYNLQFWVCIITEFPELATPGKTVEKAKLNLSHFGTPHRTDSDSMVRLQATSCPGLLLGGFRCGQGLVFEADRFSFWIVDTKAIVDGAAPIQQGIMQIPIFGWQQPSGNIWLVLRQ